MKRRISRHLALASTALALAACGGSGSDRTAAVSVGAIEARPGLVVNGSSFSTAKANVVVDGVGGQPATAFKPGRIARVQHSGGEASEVRIDPILEGKIGQKTVVGLSTTIDVRGVKISVDDSTVIVDPSGATTTFASIPSGGRFSVHGFPDDSGSIRASRIEITPGSSEDLELKGFVSALDTSAKTFTLEPTSATTIAVTLAPGATLPAGIQNGSFVEVRTTVAPGPGGTFVAASVSLEDAKFGANVEAEIEGIVMSGDSDEFVVLGTTVVTSGATVFENGDPAELLPGVKVEAEGSLDGSGVLHARKVSFRANLRLKGVPTSVGAGTFELLGFTVHVDPFTDTDGATINTTDAFEVRARLHGNGSDLVAERIDDRGTDPKLFLQGPVSSKDAAAKTLTILGVTIDVSTAELRDANDNAILGTGRFTTFFGLISPPVTVVKARGDGPGSLVGNVLTAEQAEIEGTR